MIGNRINMAKTKTNCIQYFHIVKIAKTYAKVIY